MFEWRGWIGYFLCLRRCVLYVWGSYFVLFWSWFCCFLYVFWRIDVFELNFCFWILEIWLKFCIGGIIFVLICVRFFLLNVLLISCFFKKKFFVRYFFLKFFLRWSYIFFCFCVVKIVEVLSVIVFVVFEVVIVNCSLLWFWFWKFFIFIFLG